MPAERLRNAAIGAVLLQKYCPGGDRCAVLEGGCGEGAVTDFLSPAQVWQPRTPLPRHPLTHTPQPL